MNYGMLLLNKIVEQDDVKAIARHGLEPAHFATEGERQALQFIRDYARANGGKAPSYAVMVEECPTFDYVPQVDDNYAYLTGQVKAHAAKTQLMAYLQNDFSTAFNGERDGAKLLDRLQDKVAELKRSTTTSAKVGLSVKDDNDVFRAEYAKRKAGESSRYWRSKYSIINDGAGGYASSNMYVIYGRSGRGKSAVALDEMVELAFQGATCLVWLMEMGWFEGMVRLYTYISARTGVVMAALDGVNFDAGFNSRDMRKGEFADDFEAKFMAFLDEINDILPGNIILRGVDDDNFTDRHLSALEADAINTKADVVLVDPFYYMDYEVNTSKTSGGDAANTSKGLRRLTGSLDVVMFAITQADETDEVLNDEGTRELALPKRKEVSKTKALLQDAAVLIAVDTMYKESRGIIGLNKGRDGGEDEVCEIVFLPQVGVIKEAVVAPDQFGF
ncbi:DnaB-like helicase C-terminal domain-containing protein [uncultured Planococcus sp.]|uniref:DnaB-like helicase C-terminal domain-containing protein n=1 Tax=uncultured Planococcus sp. TaxID=337815 RepID=UPI00260BCD86|nr:DnaB-like helicase C-terminal domain-containing protein [uncultured Planococcus sp.]